MQSLDQQPKTSDDVEPNGGDKPMRRPSPVTCRAGGDATLLDEDEVSQEIARLLWTIVAVILAVLIGAGVYSYRMVGTVLEQAKSSAGMQDQIGAAGRRIDAAEATLRSWTSQRDAWSKRLSSVESRIDGTLRAARKQAEEIVARASRKCGRSSTSGRQACRRGWTGFRPLRIGRHPSETPGGATQPGPGCQ